MPLEPCPTAPGWQPASTLLERQSDEADKYLPDLTWYNPDPIPQTFPPCDLINSNFPKQPNGSQKSAKDVYEQVGGQPLALHNAEPEKFHNACALRMSIALQKSGIVIPNHPGATFKGADGKYYFLSSEALGKWMKKTFVVSIQEVFTGAQGGEYENFFLR